MSESNGGNVEQNGDHEEPKTPSPIIQVRWNDELRAAEASIDFAFYKNWDFAILALKSAIENLEQAKRDHLIQKRMTVMQQQAQEQQLLSKLHRG
jgi:hypothetical protein